MLGDGTGVWSLARSHILWSQYLSLLIRSLAKAAAGLACRGMPSALFTPAVSVCMKRLYCFSSDRTEGTLREQKGLVHRRGTNGRGGGVLFNKNSLRTSVCFAVALPNLALSDWQGEWPIHRLLCAKQFAHLYGHI